MAGICNLLCIFVITMFTIVTATDYCKMKSCKERSHTMCKYTSVSSNIATEPAKECGQSTIVGLNNNEKNDIVNEHNKLRQQVASGREKRGNPGPQPKATNMKNMTWDKELAEIAQRWVNQCKFGHDECRHIDRFKVGQNVAQSSSSGKNTATVKDLILLWYAEVKDFNNTKVGKYEFESKTGHYTQLVWANSTKIGCGKIEHKDSNDRNNLILGCNYGPNGNTIGQKIYEVQK